MLPFTPRLTTVFASRWKAAFWAASVLVSAYFMVPRAGEPSALDAAQPEQAATTPANLPTAQPAANPSPWGK